MNADELFQEYRLLVGKLNELKQVLFEHKTDENGHLHSVQQERSVPFDSHPKYRRMYEYRDVIHLGNGAKDIIIPDNNIWLEHLDGKISEFQRDPVLDLSIDENSN